MKATENLYDVFRKYYVQGNLRGRSCDCCVSDEDIRQALTTPMRKLSEYGLQTFMTEAITTFGYIEDYKHFLPRILELMQTANNDFLEDFFTFEKLNYAEWETWNQEEQEVIEVYFAALWEDKIQDETISFDKIRIFLDIIVRYIGIPKGLQIWEKNASKKSILFMVNWVWEKYNLRRDQQSETLYDWFSSETMKEKVFDLFFETENKVDATKISVVYTVLDQHKN